MQPDFQIIPAAVADANALTTLVNSAYRGESSKAGWTTEADLLDGTRTSPELLEEILSRPDTTILKYLEDEKLLACVELRLLGDKMYLGMLTVSPMLQGKGIGKMLLNASEALAKEKKCNAVYMTVISLRNELIAWYNRCGYTTTGERKPFVVPDTRWGIPKQKMEFVVLEKKIN